MRTEGVAPGRRQRGLTLLEVMAAVALMGLVYTALASKATQGVMSESDSLRRFQASLIADEKLAGIETAAAQQQAPELGTIEEETEDGLFVVSLEVEPWSLPALEDAETDRKPPSVAEDILGDGDQDPGALLEVRVRIAWDSGRGERSIERSTFVLDYARLRELGPADQAQGPADL